MRSLSGLYVQYNVIVSKAIEETGETRVRTDSFNFDVSLSIQIKKNKFQLEE